MVRNPPLSMNTSDMQRRELVLIRYIRDVLIGGNLTRLRRSEVAISGYIFRDINFDPRIIDTVTTLCRGDVHDTITSSKWYHIEHLAR